MTSPLIDLPLHVGPHQFRVRPKISSRAAAALTDPPEGETNAQAVERVIAQIAGLMPDPAEGARFAALWDDPDYTQGMLLDLWDELIVHYTRRPTQKPSPSSAGFGLPRGGSNSTPDSSSPATPASTTSPTTSGVS